LADNDANALIESVRKLLDETARERIRGGLNEFERAARKLNGVDVADPEYPELWEDLSCARGRVLHACGLDQEPHRNRARWAEIDSVVNVFLDEIGGYMMNADNPDDREAWKRKVDPHRIQIEAHGAEALNLD
jgi:hypothetical protein